MNVRIAFRSALIPVAFSACALLGAATPPPNPSTRNSAGAPVALVVGLEGEVAALDAAHRSTALRLFDKLPAGATLQSGAGSRARLLFRGGARYDLGASSRAKLAGNELRSLSGSVVKLASVPAVLVIAPIAPEDNPGDRFPTILLRTQQITGVYPRGAVTVPADEAVLHFDLVTGAPRYSVTVSDRASGDSVFSLETAEGTVRIPRGKLKPGRSYQWSVATVERIGARAEAKGGFRTYTPEAEKARIALDQTLAKEPELDALLLKVAVDLNLGRFREVYEELRQAQGLRPQDQPLKAALDLWKERLEMKQDAGRS